MGYLHINNLYKEQLILLFKECYALEKIHGTSAHITFKVNPSNPTQRQITFFSGGESYDKFVSLFDKNALNTAFLNMGLPVDREVTVYGEAYGGSQQKMSHVYGPKLKFIAFDVNFGENYWLSVPEAESFVKSLGLEFVHYVKVSTELKALDAERDAPSVQAVRNGVSTPEDFMAGKGPKREGVVLRPLIDLTTGTGIRIICKHKGDEFRETASPRVVDDPNKLKVMEDANNIANEWVTLTRLEHVLDKIPDHSMKEIPKLLVAMTEDVMREGKGEIVDNEAVRSAIKKKTVTMYKDYLNNSLIGK